MWLDPDVALELRKGGVRPIVLMRIATDTPIRAWSGVGPLAIPADDVEDTEGAVYKGTGILADLPAVEILIGLSAARLTLALSGVSAEMLDLAEADAADVDGRAVSLGIGFETASRQLVGPIFWKATGRIEEIFTEDARTGRTAGLQMIYGAEDRRQTRFDYWSPAHQEALYPGDKGCAHTPELEEGVDIVWPSW